MPARDKDVSTMVLLQRCRFVPLLFIILFFFSCAGKPPAPELPDVREVNLQELQRLLDNREPLKALETADTLFKRGLLQENEHSTYRTEIETMIVEEFSSALDNSDFASALRYSKAAETSWVFHTRESGASYAVSGQTS